MAKSQKEISKRYEGNRSYYKLLHSFRRWKLWLATGSFIFGLALVMAFVLGFRRLPHLENFYNVGGISRQHAQIAQDCQQCHTSSNKRFSFMPILSSDKALEAGCIHCHVGFDFHQANVVSQATCISCHKEHLGTGPMKSVGDTGCQSCHGNASLMESSRAMVLTIPSRFLEYLSPPGIVYYPEPRLPDGYTKVIHTFDSDHPAFRIENEKMSDQTALQLNRLKFSHQTHMTGNIPMVDGHKLDCAYCHKLDSAKAYMQPVNYEVSCKACHSLQFDANLPGLQIPHPRDNSDTVQNFLLTLPTQIEKYAKEDLKISDQNRVKQFVFEKMSTLRERARQGDDLIHDVFYSDNQRATAGMVAGPKESAPYPGCAYCHTVETSSSGSPTIPKPLVPDRWFSHAKFNHSKHSTISCEQCHGAILSSKLNSEIALPTQASCVTCHSAKGQVVNTCVTCHGFHHTPPEGFKTASLDNPVREMLLGKQ